MNEDFIVQPAKQYFAAKTKRSNTHMNYVTKQKLAAIYIQNLLITKGIIVSDKPSNKIDYKVNTTSNSFFLSPGSFQEVFDLIKKLKNKKAKRTSDTDTKFISMPIQYYQFI